MTIKIALLKTGEYVISDVKEASKSEEFVGYVFEKPQILGFEEKNNFLSEEKTEDDDSVSIILSSWFPLSSDERFLIPPENVVTMANPLQTVKDIYIEKVGYQEESNA